MPSKQQIIDHLELCEKIVIYGGENTLYASAKRWLDNNAEDRKNAWAKSIEEQEGNYWKDDYAYRKEEEKKGLISAHSLLKKKIEDRDANPPKGLFGKIANFFGKMREKSLLGKVEKQMREYGIPQEDVDAYDKAAKEGLDENGEVKVEVLNDLKLHKNDPENQGPETQEELLADLNEKVNDAPELGEGGVENVSPAVTNEKEIGTMENPSVGS